MRQDTAVIAIGALAGLAALKLVMLAALFSRHPAVPAGGPGALVRRLSGPQRSGGGTIVGEVAMVRVGGGTGAPGIPTLVRAA